MIVQQESGRWYFACGQPDCGVCEPPRPTNLLAVFDEGRHFEICSARKAPVAA